MYIYYIQMYTFLFSDRIRYIKEVQKPSSIHHWNICFRILILRWYFFNVFVFKKIGNAR